MKSNFKTRFIQTLIVVAGLLLGVFAYAQGLEAEVGDDSAIVQHTNNTSMPWSLLAGESLNDVARLFYPKNKVMQRLFVEKSLNLSRYIQPNLNPAHRVNEDTVIVIPNIKYLIAPKVKKTSKSTVNKDIKIKKHESAEAFSFNPTLEKAYELLKAKNEYLKLEISKLNEKIERLLEEFAKLKAEIMRMIELSPSISASATSPEESMAKAPLTSSGSAASGLGRGTQNTWYLWLPILSVLFVMGLFLMLGLHKSNAHVNNRHHPTLYAKAKQKYGRINTKLFAKNNSAKTKKSPIIFSADFPLEPVAKSEYKGSMVVADLSDVGIPTIKDQELVLEQAQIYVDIQREDVAIKLLKEQINAAPKAAIQHWLLLLDIYRKTNKKQEFLRYAKLLHEHFNVMMPSWDQTDLPSAVATSLEQFEHISAKVTALWESCEKEAGKIAQTKEYLDQLIMDNRNNERMGFSLEVFKEIMFLRSMLDMRQKMAMAD